MLGGTAVVLTRLKCSLLTVSASRRQPAGVLAQSDQRCRRAEGGGNKLDRQEARAMDSHINVLRIPWYPCSNREFMSPPYLDGATTPRGWGIGRRRRCGFRDSDHHLHHCPFTSRPVAGCSLPACQFCGTAVVAGAADACKDVAMSSTGRLVRG